MFGNVKYIDPKLFNGDIQSYNINLWPTDWRSFTSFTDSNETHLSSSNSSSIMYTIKSYNSNSSNSNDLADTPNEEMFFDDAFGASFYNCARGDGKTIDTAIDFAEKQVDGKIVYNKETYNGSAFYKFKLKANVVYSFFRNAYFDDKIWFYNENKTSVWEQDSPSEKTYSVGHDCICYVEINHYNRGGGSGQSEFYITPLPEVVTKRVVVSFENNNNFTFGQSSFSYSFWYYKGDNASGTLFSLQDENTSKFCLYMNNGFMYFYNGTNHIEVEYIGDEYFNKRGIIYPIHVCVTYNFENKILSIFIDNKRVYNDTVLIDLNCNSMLFGGSTVPGIESHIDGTIKWVRTYNRVLSEDEVSSLFSEFDIDKCPGDGSSWEQPYGLIPDTFEEDTAYIIRRYSDNTKTYIHNNSSKTINVGIFGCPESYDSINENLPESVYECPWIGEIGSSIIEQYSESSCIKSNTLKRVIIGDVTINKHQDSSSYMIDLNQSTKTGSVLFYNCRFSSNGCSIDIDNNYNARAGKYLISRGSWDNFVMKNCEIVNTDISSDAFRFSSCDNVVLRNINVYSAASSRNYNGSCFSFINISSSDGAYDDFYSASTGGETRNIDIKNINMEIRGNTGGQIPGLIISNNCIRAKIEDISITQGNDLTGTPSNVVAYNGLINIRWIYDYDIKNIVINVPLIKKVRYWPVVMFCVTGAGKIVNTSSSSNRDNNTSQGTGQRHSIDNIHISVGDDSSDKNALNEIDYYNTDQNRFPLYSVFCVYSNDNPSFDIHTVENCSISSPRCASVALSGVFGSFVNVNGKIRLNRSRIDIKNFTSIYNSNIINIWDGGEANINNLTVLNPGGNNLILYNKMISEYLGSHVFVKNSNCPIMQNSYIKTNGGENNAFIYCPNTTIDGGFQMVGMSHAIIPVEIYRKNGHGISLRLDKSGSHATAFRFPPEPYKGIAYSLGRGKRKMTVHFAEAEYNITGKTYLDMLDYLWIEVVTSDNVYNSKLDGTWLADDEEWSIEQVEAFKFTINFELEESEKVFVRVYYNVDVHSGGGLFLDPKIDWE